MTSCPFQAQVVSGGTIAPTREHTVPCECETSRTALFSRCFCFVFLRIFAGGSLASAVCRNLCCEQALQNQLYGGQPSPWNFGAAYRIPDTNINLSGTYQQGKANLQARIWTGFEALKRLIPALFFSTGDVNRVSFQRDRLRVMFAPMCGDHVDGHISVSVNSLDVEPVS